MQINNNVQPSEFHPTIERVAEKSPKVEEKSQKFEEIEKELFTSEKFDELKSVLDEGNISLTFSQDETTKALVVKLVDKITGEEIRQIPTEVSLKLVAVNAKLLGNFVDKDS